VLTGDRGLAGAFNVNIIRRGLQVSERLRGEGAADLAYVALGKKGVGTLRFRGLPVEREYQGFSTDPSYDDAAQVVDYLVERFTSGEVDRAVLVYNAFRSVLEQRVTEEQLLPVPRQVVEEEQEGDGEPTFSKALALFEPDAKEFLERLLPTYLNTAVYRALLEDAPHALKLAFGGLQEAAAIQDARERIGERSRGDGGDLTRLESHTTAGAESCDSSGRGQRQRDSERAEIIQEKNELAATPEAELAELTALHRHGHPNRHALCDSDTTGNCNSNRHGNAGRRLTENTGPPRRNAVARDSNHVEQGANDEEHEQAAGAVVSIERMPSRRLLRQPGEDDGTHQRKREGVERDAGHQRHEPDEARHGQRLAPRSIAHGVGRGKRKRQDTDISVHYL